MFTISGDWEVDRSIVSGEVEVKKNKQKKTVPRATLGWYKVLESCKVSKVQNILSVPNSYHFKPSLLVEMILFLSDCLI